jgi:molybdate transport system substrate-binding protein
LLISGALVIESFLFCREFHMRRLLMSTLLLFGLAVPTLAADVPPIAAAAVLKFALTDIAEDFERQTGNKVRLSFGSSGNFTHQLQQGAPFQLFLSADEQSILQLADKGLTEDRGVLYATGRMVLFAPHGSPLRVDAELRDLRAALADGRLRRLAIANPEHAPYGRAARAVLRHAGLWADIEKKLVIGENAAQAMQFAASGSSQGGIVPLALSKAPEVARLGAFVEIPAAWHADESLHQRMVLMKSAGATARTFYDYLRQPAAREIFVRHGFALPAEEER